MYASQTDRMLDLLRQRPHNGLELRTEHGIGAPNSRRSDLENLGHVVVCDHVKGVRGPSAYVYKLISEAAPLEELAEGTPAPSASSSSDALLTSHADDAQWESSAEGETMAPSAEPAEPEPLFTTAPPPEDGDGGWRELYG